MDRPSSWGGHFSGTTGTAFLSRDIPVTFAAFIARIQFAELGWKRFPSQLIFLRAKTEVKGRPNVNLSAANRLFA
jgi:hypothetical protein